MRTKYWHERTLGEKILTVILGILKWGLIITAGLAIGAVVLAVVGGGYIALVIADAFVSSLGSSTSDVYEVGDYYVWHR